MPDAYEVHDAQYRETLSAGSAADALTISLPNVPAGRVRTVLSAYATCSVVETQTYWFAVSSSSILFPITMPTTRTIIHASYQFVPCLLEGMEIKLFPGETLTAVRAVATAGSTIQIYARVIETELQYFVELDKHKVLRRRAEAMQDSNPGFFRRGGFGRSSAFVSDVRERSPREK